jgi:hypothetical protein
VKGPRPAAGQRLAALGAAVPEILLPRKEIDLSKWAVIACDQFTQDRPYWEAVRKAAGNSPSALNLIYPEVYLKDGDRKERIAAIHRSMEQYLAGGIFDPPRKSCVYLERDTPFHKGQGKSLGRRGLLICLDLEQYDWAPESRLLTRATEGTVQERIPPRMEIRRGAPLELPHILLLIDDEDDALLPALGERAKARAADQAAGGTLYDTELLPDSGRVRSWLLDREDDWEFLAAGLEKLSAGSKTEGSQAPFLYAVGDGNHSLATAKAVWEEYKKNHRGEANLENHPARWALVELENLYDPALTFEPIHRVIFGAELADVQRLLAELPGYSCRKSDGEKAAALVKEETPKTRYGLVAGDESFFLIEADPAPLAVDGLQTLLDRFQKEHPAITIDYIHGTDEVFRIMSRAGEEPGAAGVPGPIGLLLPPFRKQGLFETVVMRGPLPRKSFSMGEACEKRFYLECRKLF